MRTTPPLLRVVLAVVPALVGSCLLAQVRLDQHWNAHLEAMVSSGLATPMEINDFAAGDVDGDGDLDLLAAGNMSPSRIYYNDGDGVFSRSATIALVATSAAVLTPRVPVPELGQGLLAIDPTQLLVLDVATVPDADARAEVAHTIPDNAALLGLRVATQALFVPVGREWDARFSNVVTETIVR